MNRLLTTAVLAVAISVVGCSQKSMSPAAARQSADRAEIQGLVESSPELAVSFEDEGELVATADSSASLPIHWGRWRTPPNHPPSRTIAFLIPPDSDRALVEVNVKFDGWFFVDRTADGLRNPGKKPLRDQKTRYALFRKIWFHRDSTSTDSVFGWRLVAVSPVEFTMIDPSRQTVSIHAVTLTGESGQITLTHPATLLYLRRSSELPRFRYGETVKVEAAVANTDHGYSPPTFVYLHVPTSNRLLPGPFDWNRVLMVDDGSGGDVKAGDGIYTGSWTVRTWGLSHVGIDVLNSRCLQNETQDDYNSTTWGVPFEGYLSLEAVTSAPAPGR